MRFHRALAGALLGFWLVFLAAGVLHAADHDHETPCSVCLTIDSGWTVPVPDLDPDLPVRGFVWTNHSEPELERDLGPASARAPPTAPFL